MGKSVAEKSTLIELATIMAGLAAGGFIGPLVFQFSYPAAVTLSCAVGGVCGYAIARMILSIGRRRRDRQLAEAIRHELISIAHLPDTIQIEVKGGRAVLRGEVDDYSQRLQAAHAISGIPGIRTVENHLRLRPAAGTANPDDVRQAVQGALRSAAELDSLGIQVKVHDSRVTLEGKVRSWTEASEAEEAAWAIPGVAEVENRLRAES